MTPRFSNLHSKLRNRYPAFRFDNQNFSCLSIAAVTAYQLPRFTTLIVLIVILLLGYTLRIYRLGTQNIWWDEGLAIWAVRKSFAEMTLWTARDVHPPLYFWLLWPWMRLAGDSEFAARYITLGFGMLTVALAYVVGKRLAGSAVGLLALLLIAISRFEVWWSQEMRMYMLAGFTGFLATYWLLRLVTLWEPTTNDERRSSKLGVGDWRSGAAEAGMWGAYVLAMVAALHVIYLSMVFVIVHNVWVLGLVIRRSLDRRRTFVRRWIAAQVVIGGASLPWLALALPRMQSWRIIEKPPSLRFVSELYATLLVTGISTNIENAWLPTAVIVALVLVGATLGVHNSHFTVRNPQSLLYLLFVITPPVLVWLITQPRSIFYSPRVEARYLLPFAAPAYVLLAGTVGALWERWWPAGVASLLVILVVFLQRLPDHYQDRYLRDDLQSLVQVIYAYAQPGDAVALVSGNRYPVFLYDYDRVFDEASIRPPVYQLPRISSAMTEDTVDVELAPVVAQHDRVWLAWVDGPMQDPDRLSETWLNHHRVRTLSLGFAHNALHLYGSAPGEPVVPGARWMHDLGVDVGAVRVMGYDLTTKEFRPGDTIRLGLYFQASEPAPLIVRWVSETDRTLAQQRISIPGMGASLIRRQVEFAVSEVVPAGQYHFELGTASARDPHPFGGLVVNRTHGPALDAPPAYAMQSQVGEHVQFLGYRLSSERGKDLEALAPGQTVNLDLFWHATGSIGERLTVFAHILGDAHNPATGGPVWAGHDSEPLMGAVPTTWWPTEAVVVDRHPLTLDPGAPPGTYQIEIGLYDARTSERVSVAGDGADEGNRRILLGTVRVQRD